MTVLEKLTEIVLHATNGEESVADGVQRIYDTIVVDVAPHMGLGKSDIDFLITRLYVRYNQRKR